jgi:Mycothiol maleylpyruvate isomerase N-terminal domain
VNRTRQAFLAMAAAAADLVDQPEVAERWDEPGASVGMTVGAVAAHLVGSGIEMPLRCLDGEEPPGERALDPSRFFSGQTLDLDHEQHRQVRDRALEGADRGVEVWRAAARSSLRELARRLPDESEARRVVVLERFFMRFDDVLVTRIVELIAHSDDLAASVGVPTPEAPADAVDIFSSCLVNVARRRHGDLAVVRTLARGDRAPAGVFPVF